MKRENRGAGIVAAFLAGCLVTAGLLDDGVRQRPIVAMLVIAAVMGAGFLWARRALCARWIGRHALGYADSVDARKLAVENWRVMILGDKSTREIEDFANGR